MIRLLIKGRVAEATEAAARRHILLLDPQEWGSPNGPMVRAEASEADLLRVCAWLQEAPEPAAEGPGLAAGTLLHFTCRR